MGSLEHNELRTDLTNFNRQFNRLPTTQEYQEDDKLKVQSVFQRHRRKPKRNHARFHRHINITKVLILPKYLNLTHLRSLKTAIHIIKVTHIDQFFVLKSLTKHCLYYITTTLKCFASSGVQVVSRQKLNCNRENIEVYRVKYDFFSIRIEFLTTNDLDPEFPDCQRNRRI